MGDVHDEKVLPTRLPVFHLVRHIPDHAVSATWVKKQDTLYSCS